MTHKVQSINIKSLLLDIENPRFEPVKDQKHALAVMMGKIKLKIKYLAGDMAKNGLNPVKLWYVIPKDEKYIVLEGNRRLTAIRLINNPKVIELDKKTVEFFQNLKKDFDKSISQTINCAVFKNREHARPWIEREHTGENKGIGLVKWSSEQANRFRSRGLDSKLSKDALYLKFMRANKLNVDKIDATSLGRLVGTPFVRKQIGLDIKNGLPKYTKATKDVVSNLKKVSDAMNKADFNVGKIYMAAQREKWICNLLNEKESIAHASSDTVTDKKNDSRRKKTDIETLIPPSFQINISQEKIKSICLELKKLNINEFRNAVAVLFRVFMELNVDYFITNMPKEKRPSIQLPLRTKLKHVSDYMQDKKLLTKDELKAARTAASNDDSIFSINTFNSYVHNLDHTPEVGNLKTPWNNMEKFIQKLWE